MFEDGNWRINGVTPVILTLGLVVGLGACASGGGGAGAAGPEAAVDAPVDVTGQVSLPDNQWTTTAQENLVIARLRVDNPAEQRQYYQDALDAALLSIQNEPQNARGYFLAGRAYVGLGDYIGADSVLATAVELYPEYEQQVEVVRENAWVMEYNAGVESLQDTAQVATGTAVENAVAHFAKADLIYQGRPEARINLGRLYVQQDQPAKALEVFEGALAILTGPRPEDLTTEQLAQWDQWEEDVTLYISQLSANTAIAAFNAGNYELAVQGFRESLERNPYSRDMRYNLAQTLWLLSQDLKEQMADADGAQAAELEAELETIYQELIEVTNRLLEMDPYNRNALLLLYRGYQGLGQFVEGARADEIQARAQALVQRYQELPFHITDLLPTMGQGQVTLSGQLTNLTLQEGEPVTLRFTFLGQGGETLGTEDVTITAPAAQQAVAFEVAFQTDAAVTGWSYEVVDAG